jgi:hypothetical protein
MRNTLAPGRPGWWEKERRIRPPTVTSRGTITWIQLPELNALRLCREIDVLAALRTALNDHPASH